jgi:hypothetical protein
MVIGVFNFKQEDISRLKSMFPDNKILHDHLDNKDFSAVTEVQKYVRELGQMSVRMAEDVTFSDD